MLIANNSFGGHGGAITAASNKDANIADSAVLVHRVNSCDQNIDCIMINATKKSI